MGLMVYKHTTAVEPVYIDFPPDPCEVNDMGMMREKIDPHNHTVVKFGPLSTTLGDLAVMGYELVVYYSSADARASLLQSPRKVNVCLENTHNRRQRYRVARVPFSTIRQLRSLAKFVSSGVDLTHKRAQDSDQVASTREQVQQRALVEPEATSLLGAVQPQDQTLTEIEQLHQRYQHVNVKTVPIEMIGNKTRQQWVRDQLVLARENGAL